MSNEVDDYLEGALQDNILTLLCFDDSAAGLIKHSISPNMFESSVHRRIASVAMSYHNDFGEAAGDHLPDLLEDELEGSDRKAGTYNRIVLNLHDLSEGINSEYVLGQLNNFVRNQSLKQSIVEAAKLLKSGDLESAEEVINKGTRTRIKTFEPGTIFKDDYATALNKLLVDDTKRIDLGIPYFTKIKLGPSPKELLIILTPTNKGKSWFFVHCAKFGVMQRKKVLLVTLEMSEPKFTGRLLQNFFAISKRDADIRVTKLDKDEDGKFAGIDFDNVTRPVMHDPKISKILKSKVRKLGNKGKLIIKEFPTDSLTMRGLESYLDNMEQFYNFVPDMLLVDYADLMDFEKSGSENRVALGKLFKQLRRIATERNISVVTGSQTNRGGQDATKVDLKHIAEDFSKTNTADIIITYSQTDVEEIYNLARLYVAKNRDEEKGRSILITQSYAMGQFALDSMLLDKNYWKEINDLTDEGGNDNG